MLKDFGVKKDGTDEWVVTLTPLVLGSEDTATLYTEADAMGIAAYLTQNEVVPFSVGRPGDRHPK